MFQVMEPMVANKIDKMMRDALRARGIVKSDSLYDQRLQELYDDLHDLGFRPTEWVEPPRLV